MKHINKVLAIIIALIVLVSCTKENKKDTHEAHGSHEEDSHTEIVTITTKQKEVLRLKTGHVKIKQLAEVIHANGELELPPNDKADVSSLAAGVVTKVNVIEGSPVKKGQVLATIEHPEIIQIQQDYMSYVNELEYLTKERNRQQKLYNEKVGSGKTYQKISSEYEVTLANVDGLKAKLIMFGIDPEKVKSGKISPSISIKSPITGTISLVEINIGSYVQPQDKLFEVVDNNDLHVALKLYEKDVSGVKIGQKITFKISNSGTLYKGEIFAISPSFEDNPKTIHVHAHIHGDKTNLLAGMYIQGQIIINETEKVKTLPEDAIVSEGTNSYVFMVENPTKHTHEVNTSDSEPTNSNLKFSQLQVITGEKEQGFVEVKFFKNIPSDSKFAITQAYYLQAEMSKGKVEHSH